ncbi:MAG: Cys-Gln thioester bond-forming surface protein [Bacilli bacterium]|nr:Cys-Gln thioester bond-forming surface protein [Bacilli bacterium]
MKKILIIFIISMCFITKEISASNIEEYIINGERIDDIYFRKVATPTKKWLFYGDVLRRQSDNHFVYSIEPGMKLNNKASIGTTDISQTTMINYEEWEKVKLYAYYGYNYQDETHNHLDIKWYFATQLLIWKYLRPSWDIYFTDTFNGNKISKYEDELLEIESLANNHFIIPKLDDYLYEINIGETLEITDQNNVINKYKTSNNDGLDLIIKDNKLIIKGTSPGEYQVKLYQDSNLQEEESMIYVSEYLDTMIPGKLTDNEISIDIVISGGKLVIENLNNNINSTYLIFDSQDNLIKEIVLNNIFGENNIPLNFGSYYLLDNMQNKYYFEINNNNLNYHLIIEQEQEIISSEEKIISQELNDDIMYVKIPTTGAMVFNEFKYNIKEFIVPRLNYNDKKKRNI